ncbi:unnamed protein product [Hermetia illucens]|uniref:Kazal-like domain-containing protein n=1 Tax=Hermetia illucens TaxID=343691 RepID=A0A7R8UUS1_HERIL|nr:unnamed protein product [Hermetia illucens]
MYWLRYLCLLMVFSVIYAQSNKKCIRCPRMYRPVCAIEACNKRTFNSKCTMQRFNCVKNRKFKVQSQGLCDGDEAYVD